MDFSISNSIYSEEAKSHLFKLAKEPLYKSSIFIFLNVITTAAFGFFFWIVAARLYSSEDVGIASALVSSAGIIAILSSFGFTSGLIRFLPESSNREELFNSMWLIWLAGAVLFCSIFILGIGIFSPPLQFLRRPIIALFFLFYLLVQISSFFFYSGLLALRKAEYSFILNLTLGIRIILLIPLTFAGVIGVFGSFVAAYLISCIVGIILLAKTNIYLKPILSTSALIEVLKFSIANYASDFLLIGQASILPVLVLSMIGAREAGYFYIAFSIAALIYSIPTSVFTSMFIEGSHGISPKQNAVKSLRIVLLFLIPIGAFMYFFGDILLSLFGNEYSQHAFNLLKLLVISSYFVMINTMFICLKRIQKDVRILIIINLSLLAFTLLFCYFLIGRFGLIGAGLGWIASQGAVSVMILLSLFKKTLGGKSLFEEFV